MGNSNSADLECPLQQPQGSMQALDGSLIAQSQTNLCVKPASLHNRATVTDLETNSAIFLFKGKMLSSRSVLETPQGDIIASITNKAFSNKYRVFQGEQTDDDPSFIIDNISGFFKTMVLVAEFTDKKTGTPCRIVVKGDASDNVVLCHMERGSPTLSHLQKGDDFLENQDRYQPVGRIRRKSSWTHDEYFIEGTAGVDLTLLLLICHVRHEWLQSERANASS